MKKYSDVPKMIGSTEYQLVQKLLPQLNINIFAILDNSHYFNFIEKFIRLNCLVVELN